MILTNRKNKKMKTKAEVLIDQLAEAAESYDELTTQKTPYSLGDVVTLSDDNSEYVGIIEDEKDEVYQIRVQAIAGNEFEPTDKVLFRSADQIDKYDMTKNISKDTLVKWNSEAGLTYGKVVSVDEDTVTIEVHAKNDEKYEPTNVTVQLTKSALEITEFDIKEAKKQLLCKMEDVSVEIDEEKNVGIIEGFGSTYGNVDLGGDTVEKGAYTQTLKHKGGKVKLFFDHGWTTKDMAGLAYLEDKEQGLWVRGEMPIEASDVRDAFIKIKFLLDRGEKTGLSIGYNVIKSNYNDDGTRSLKEIALEEMTITPFPMDTQANILEARSKRIAYKSMQNKWATLSDAPNGNQDEQGDSEFDELLAEIKSMIKPKKQNNE